MAGTEFLEGTPGVSSYATAVKARLKGLLAYADLNEISPSGASQPRAFESAVAPPEGPVATPTTTTTPGPRWTFSRPIN